MFSRILIATDFSTCAEAARSLGADLAQIHRAELILLHVQEPLPAYSYAEVGTPDLERIHAEHSRWAQARLEEYVHQASAAGLRATASVRTGAAPEEIAGAVQEHGADLIVVGTHGRTGLNRLLVGSVAERVLRVAPCPVLAVNARTAEVHQKKDPTRQAA